MLIIGIEFVDIHGILMDMIEPLYNHVNHSNLWILMEFHEQKRCYNEDTQRSKLLGRESNVGLSDQNVQALHSPGNDIRDGGAAWRVGYAWRKPQIFGGKGP